MTSLVDYLRQNSPRLPTREALILVGLQNDFLGPEGKLLVQHSSTLASRIATIIPQFRQFADIIWIRTETDPEHELEDHCLDDDNVIVEDSEDDSHAGCEDKELFLQSIPVSSRACIKGSEGAELHPQLQELIRKQDVQITKKQYSAFGGTNLLMSLRSRLVTKIYVCGALTNISVHATALDAARCGMETVLIRDCLGYRSQKRHDQAIRQLGRYSAATISSSQRILASHGAPNDDEDDEDNAEGTASDHEIAAELGALEVDSDDSGEEEDTLDLETLRSCAKPIVAASHTPSYKVPAAPQTKRKRDDLR